MSGMPPEALPKQIHRYRILSELGRGSMGRVYLARDPNIERRIALKVLMPERLRGAGGEELRQRFLQEAKAAGGLSHRGIVTIYDADTDPDSGCPYLAMEWVPGCSLKTLLRREGPLAPERAVSMAAQVARALDYAHRREVVHRDVKPANLLVSGGEGHPEGGRAENVKVVDFGIAKLVSKSLTQPGRVLGSPYYMAPEQVRGLKIDGRSDLFALGAVLYECLTGRVAFSGETVASVSHKILAVDPRPIDNPEVPASLKAVVRRALEKLPQDRYRSGAELAAALETVGAELALGPSPATAPSPLEQSGTTTEVMSGRHAERAQADPAAGAGQPAPAAANGWRWSRGLALAALLLIAGVLVGRSLDPQIPGVADRGAESGAGAAADDLAPIPFRGDAREGQATPVPESRPEAPAPPAGELEADSPAEDGPGQSGGDPPGSPAPPDDPSRGPGVEAQAVPPPASPPPPAAAVATTNIEIVHENRVKLAYLSVWVDGRRALSVKLETKNPFKRIKGREHRWLIPVPAGKHSVEVHVSGVSKRLEARNKIWRVFSVVDPQRLTVELLPGSRQLGFLWEDR